MDGPQKSHITQKNSSPSFHLNIHTSFFLQEAGLNWSLEDIWPINFQTREFLRFHDWSFDFWQIPYSASGFFLMFAQIWFCFTSWFFLCNVFVTLENAMWTLTLQFMATGAEWGTVSLKQNTHLQNMLCRKTKKNILFVMSNRLNENISCAKKLAEFLTCEIVP